MGFLALTCLQPHKKGLLKKKKSAKCFQVLGLEIAFLMLFLLWTKHITIKLGSSLPDGLNFLNYLHGNIKLKFRKKKKKKKNYLTNQSSAIQYGLIPQNKLFVVWKAP